MFVAMYIVYVDFMNEMFILNFRFSVKVESLKCAFENEIADMMRQV